MPDFHCLRRGGVPILGPDSNLYLFAMNTNVRFCRVVAAALLGALLWAACSSPEQRFSANSHQQSQTHSARVGKLETSHDSISVPQKEVSQASLDAAKVIYEGAGAERSTDSLESYREELAEIALRQAGVK